MEPVPRSLALVVIAGLACCDGDAPSSSASSAGTTSSGGTGNSSSVTVTVGPGGTTSSSGQGGAPPGWQPVPWWSGSCQFQYAEEPASAFPPLNWIGCLNAEPGCERIEKNWPKLSPTAIAGPWVRRAGQSHKIGLIAGLVDYEYRMAFIGSDGIATAVYRTPPNGECIPTRLGVADDGHWVGVQNVGEGAVNVFQPDGAPPSNALISTITATSQDQVGGQNLYAAQYDFGVGVELFDRATSTKHTSPAGLGMTTPALHDDAAFLLGVPTYNQPDGWVWTRERGVFEELVVRDPNHVMDVRGDGEYLVWIQAGSDDNGTWPPGALYTSPYTTVQADVVPTFRRTTVAVGPVPLAAIGGGHYAYYSGYDGQITVVRLSDAHEWKFPPPVEEGGGGVRDIAYIDEEYIFFRSVTEMYRQRLDALGPGEPAG